MQVLAKGSHKAPWKYLDSIGVEELSFGLVPPTLQVASAKFEPSTSMLTLSMDVRFTSSSAQAVVSAEAAAGCRQPLPVDMTLHRSSLGSPITRSSMPARVAQHLSAGASGKRVFGEGGRCFELATFLAR